MSWKDLFSRGKSEKAMPQLRAIGHPGDACPYCHAPLVRMPKRKSPCPQCAQVIYPRTRPLDKQKVLLRSDELGELEEQLAIANGTYAEYQRKRERFENVRAELAVKFGRDPLDSDVNWRILSDDLIGQAKDGRWGLYRNTKHHMAVLLTTENKLSDALVAWLEVSCLDMNGANNAGPLTDQIRADVKEIFGERPLEGFDLRAAFPVPLFCKEILECADKMALSIPQMESAFLQAYRRMPSKSKLPLSCAEAWSQLSTALESFMAKRKKH